MTFLVTIFGHQPSLENEMNTTTLSRIGFACICVLLGAAVGCSKESPTPAADEAKPASSAVTEAKSEQRHALPPNNPYLMQDSAYSHVHFDAAANDASRLAAWTGDRTLNDANVDWLPWVTTIGTAHRPYVNGEEALIVSGSNKVGKIRISNGEFSWIDEIIVPGFEYDTPPVEQIEETVEAMRTAGNDEAEYLRPFAEHISNIRQGAATIMNGAYTVMDHEGNYYAGWGTTVHKVSDVNPGDINSKIEIVSSYNIKDGLSPEEAEKINRLVAISMTYDGYLAIAMPGIIAVLDRELSKMEYILLEGEAVDNGISVDKDGGIYLVTSKYMRKLVWNGETLSDREEDGAWKTTYDDVPNPKSLSRGAGNTPALMGHGPDDDKLVLLADSGEKIKVVAFWRDEIPEDFEQRPGTKSRRIADQLDLTIDVPATIEWSPHIYGNGVMMMASAWPDPIYDESGKMQLFDTIMTAGATRAPPVGVEKWSWDKETRTLKSDWTVLRGLQWALYPVSAADNSVTLTVFEEGIYSLLTVDWDTGEELGNAVLGNSPILNTMGGLYIPIDADRTYITGVFGPVMINKE
jgi:hypothetical protein